jgi:SMI1/KNR4 family protein SUKH-1
MATDWRELLEGTKLHLTTAADQMAMRAVEAQLGHRLSLGLRDLYLHSNGILDEWGYAYVLPVEELVRRRDELREPWAAMYASFDDLFVVGQLGNGDLLMHPLKARRPAETLIRWDHEDDRREYFAAGLAEAVTVL